ncbi:hypothetical protein BJQ94_11085 [Cryobacterium sp. SO2]|uniref:hypothetical protein n=1 Tax=Cryobacterium sp. SO2 TaxID=1897060 RepID=UPI0023DB2D77|nr:hypothetical protein [Cryobacterium sp. SO2]WEO75924.1 hypothetical protein BJQ94_11085 [Cryobacterium sp. SO2]
MADRERTAEVGDDWRDREQRRQQLLAGLDRPHEDRIDLSEAAATEELGHLLDVGHVDQAQEQAELRRRIQQDVGRRPEDDLGRLGRKQDLAAEELGRRVQVDLEGGHHTEEAAGAPHAPEQVGVALPGDAAQHPGGVDEFHGPDRVRGQALPPAEPGMPAGEQVARDADVGVGAGQGDEAGAVEAAEQGAPRNTGADAREPGDDVHGHLVESVRAHQDPAAEVIISAVTPGLHRHADAGFPGGHDDMPEVPHRARPGDGSGLLVDGEVPRRPGVVPARIAGQEQIAVELAGQRG